MHQSQFYIFLGSKKKCILEITFENFLYLYEEYQVKMLQEGKLLEI